MFALEIDFHDGVSSPEILLVRRPHVLVGSSEYAHVVIEGAGSGSVELRLLRGLGREFRCQPVTRPGAAATRPMFLEGVYQGDAQINLGEVTIHATALDIDLRLQGDESPDQAGIRVARQAFSRPTPQFPAVAVLGGTPLFSSFCASEPLIIGRSRKCGLRLDASDISSEHARVGFENDQFWIEDLGSTNGTFIGENRISGRQPLASNEVFRLGAEYRLAPVATRQDIANLKLHRDSSPEPSVLREMYPCVISQSELIRPSRFVIPEGATVSLGRDPTNDIWVGAPHVSRRHLEIRMNPNGAIELFDSSSNGTFVNSERLPSGEPFELGRSRTDIDLNEGVVIHLCYSQEDEQALADGSDANRPVIRESIQLSSMDDDRTEVYQRAEEDTASEFVDRSAPPPLQEEPPVFNMESSAFAEEQVFGGAEPQGDELKVQSGPAGMFDRLLEQQEQAARRLESDPSTARVEEEYQDSQTAPRRSRSGLLFLVVALLVIGGVIYFLYSKGMISAELLSKDTISDSENAAGESDSAADGDIE